MSVMTKELYVMFEALDHKIDLLIEIVTPLATLPERVDNLERSVEGMRSEMDTMKLAVKDTNLELTEFKLETRQNFEKINRRLDKVEVSVERLDKESKTHTAQFNKLQKALTF